VMSNFKSLESKMNKHPDYTPIYNDDIHHFFNQCLILTDRNLRLLRRSQQLEEAGDRMAKRLDEVYDMITFDSRLKDAVENWERVRVEY